VVPAEEGTIPDAGIPVAFAGTVIDRTPAIVSNAVKSGYDAAQRIAAALAGNRPTRDRPTREHQEILNGASA
jgi:hypothetical protein